jgi:hypothetical protein
LCLCRSVAPSTSLEGEYQDSMSAGSVFPIYFGPKRVHTATMRLTRLLTSNYIFSAQKTLADTDVPVLVFGSTPVEMLGRLLARRIKSRPSAFLIFFMIHHMSFCCGRCSEAKIKSVLLFPFCTVLFWSVVVAISIVATYMICLHDVSLMYTCVESAHRVEVGALRQRTWHT